MRKWILLAVLFFSLGNNAHALTLGDMKVQIRQRVNDRADPKLRYSDSVLNGFINEAQKDVVNDTWCLQNTTFYMLAAGTTYYNLPNDYLAIMQVNFRESNGRIRSLEEKSKRALFDENPDWARQTGTPVNYFTQVSTSGTSVNTTLQIVYIPIATSASTGTAIIDYYSQVTTLASDSDVPLNGFRHLYPYHHAIVDLVTYRIKMIEGKAEEAKAYFELYSARIQAMVNRFQSSPNYFPNVSAATSRTR